MADRYELRLPTGGIYQAATLEDLRSALAFAATFDLPMQVVRIAEDGRETELSPAEQEALSANEEEGVVSHLRAAINEYETYLQRREEYDDPHGVVEEGRRYLASLRGLLKKEEG